MAKRSLADLKAAWKKNTSSSSDNFPNNYYPFYRMPTDSKATVRFLPDLNEENPLGFVYEKFTHTLKVNGKDRTVPCLKMYGKECPICKQSAEYYKEDKAKGIEKSPRGKALYRRKQTLAQVLVTEDPLQYSDDQEPALGQVKLINMSYTLINIINSAFDDEELPEMPYDYQMGTDFIIKKTQKGDHANYELSKFARKERALTEEELASIEGKLVDLSSLIPECPTDDKVRQLLDAHINGTPVQEGNSSASAPASSNDSNGIDPQTNRQAPASYGNDSQPAAEDEPPFDVADTTEQAPAPAAAAEETTPSSDDGYQDEADSILDQLKKNRAAAAAK